MALALTHDYGADKTVGSLGYTFFVIAMMTGRFMGTGLLNKFGRVKVLRVTCSMAIIGLAVFIFAPNVPLGFIGLFIWGLGASLGFPTGMSAASDDPMKAAIRVSVVSTIGYAAFLGGPPALGLLGEHWGIRNALLAVLVFIVISLFLTRHLQPSSQREILSERTTNVSTYDPQTSMNPVITPETGALSQVDKK